MIWLHCRLRDDVVGVGPTIEIAIPSDPRQRFVIDAVAFYVMRDGTEFEQARPALPCRTHIAATRPPCLDWRAPGQPASPATRPEPRCAFFLARRC